MGKRKVDLQRELEDKAAQLPDWIDVDVDLKENKGACPPGDTCPNKPNGWCGKNCPIIQRWQEANAARVGITVPAKGGRHVRSYIH